MNLPLTNPAAPSRSFSVSLPAPDVRYVDLLGGSAPTPSMHAGCVTLPPGESVGLHSTGANQEMLVTLSGRGELCQPGFDSLPMHAGCVLYNPPDTPHDVVNRGDVPLRYIYIVARA